mmetsp:Transcript_128785/g.372619  ORF Transcript_128785/g.372619 Transcript_128785/m.372619 type:complete len:455 (-) Transcript_128785:192-1556(-)
MSEPIDDVAAAEAARSQAEARRKRILEKANKRMGVVSGEQALAEDEKAASEAKAARIRAARNRRYKKKTTTTATTAEEKEDGGAPFDEPKPSDTSTAAAEENASATPVEIEKKEEAKPEPEETTETAATADDKSADGADAPKKKYLGVARMRRNMIKKRKQEEEEDADGKKEGTAAIEETQVDIKSLSKEPLKVNTFPIYMHIFTILLLFLAGMDVSLQQYHYSLKVDSELAFVQHGIPVVHRKLGPISTAETKSGIFDQDYFAANDGDEFQEEESQPPNIDPLFGVDLDALTSGPGIMNQLARGAVAAHRSLLWFVYYLPLSILQSIMGIPQALMRSPPALCIIALLLRHVVGKGILGAGLPETTAVDEKGIDVIAMAKNFVTNMLNNSFPTAVVLYDAFTHLRADMYVVLCGVFSGLVYVHYLASSEGQDTTPEAGDLAQEELAGAILNDEL